MNIRTLLPLILLDSVQILDILLHVVTNQFELIRVIASAVIMGGAVIALLKPDLARMSLLISGIPYLLLNIVFLVQDGVINPNTGTPRIPLIVFVFASLLLANWMASRARKPQKDV